MTRLILDVNGCHGNSMEKIEELLDLGKEVGAAIKFQLFYNLQPNPETNRKLFRQALALCEGPGMPEIFASVWDEEALNILDRAGCPSIKFAYSQRYNKGLIQMALKTFEKIYISYGWNDVIQEDPSIIPLYIIPDAYPVVHRIDFSGIFPRFKGFSSHCIGIDQNVEAVKAGADVLEVHIMPEEPADCPDRAFALTPTQVRSLHDTIVRLPRFNGGPLEKHTGETGTKSTDSGSGVRADSGH